MHTERMDRLMRDEQKHYPPGTRRVSEAERRQTLENLHKKKAILMRQLDQVPVTMDTYRVRTMKRKIDSEMDEIEDAIRTFSRRDVFVQV